MSLITTHHAALPAAVDPGLANDAACTLVELSTVPDDAALQRRAAQELPQLMAQLRATTGHSDAGTTVSDADWLDVWRPFGVVVERTR
ncbi:hypothetical protein [Streptomyces sp. NEAU-S7GS2]|uniref:hypothetical protein n=1 Tax=Streptomyces sp. NEAU-S7GS2 TaxID=2202000 RepID=UPI000D6FD640|nr:hypothetical protein [Streptomyces sp. NEAU-S7GS2]AWN32605.1 hypothetical protein DKG71_42250 [Streptomyces sp. NEAU-S7GS2]